MNRPLEPGLIKVFRYFTLVAMVYFAVVQAFNFALPGHGFSLRVQTIVNFINNLALFGYLSWPALERRLKGWYLPLALLAATALPVFSSLIYLVDPVATDMPGIIIRSWLVLPILLVPLVIVAWQYGLREVIFFVLLTTLVELSALLPQVDNLDIDTLYLLSVPIMRAIAFGIVGHIVQQMMETQRDQRRKLMHANLQLAEHSQTLEQLTTSRERNRLARELHDTLAHTLSGLAVNLEAMRTVGLSDEVELNQMLDHSLVITRNGLAETRRALKDLRAQPLETLGLGLALRNQALATAERVNLDLALEIPHELEGLPPVVEQNLYRIAVEGVENIARHSGARHASLRLVRGEGGLILTIQDDGCGFETGAEAEIAGYGLQGMRERAEVIGAQFSLSSKPGRGTTIRIHWKENYDPHRAL